MSALPAYHYDEPALPPPHNIDLEQQLIGSVMMDQSIFDRVASCVSADDFYEPMHAHIWRSIAALMAQGKAATAVTLKDMIAADTRIGDMSPVQYLVRLMSDSMPMNALDFAQGIRALSIRRGLIEAAQEISEIAAAANPTSKTDDIIRACETKLAAATGRHQAPEEIDVAGSAIEQIGRAFQRQKSDAVPWFLREVENVLGDNLEYGWLVGLLADSGGGKTSFALQVAEYALRQRVPVLFLSGDQKPEEVYRQIASQRASVRSTDLRKGKASEKEVAAAISVIKELAGLPFQVRKMGRPTTGEIAMWVRGFNRRHGRGLVIIDHAKRISFTDRRAMLAEGVNQVYGDLKALMVETDNAGLLLMQRNSDGSGRENPRPLRGDCYGGAGALENLDGLLALYVEEQWTSHLLAMARTDKRKEEIRARAALAKDKAEIIGLKARFAAGGVSEEVRREPQFTRFSSLIEDWRSGEPEMDL